MREGREGKRRGGKGREREGREKGGKNVEFHHLFLSNLTTGRPTDLLYSSITIRLCVLMCRP